jgi:hypothetical protein
MRRRYHHSPHVNVADASADAQATWPDAERPQAWLADLGGTIHVHGQGSHYGTCILLMIIYEYVDDYLYDYLRLSL